MGRFYITTPIYYVNDVPHIGHAYTTAAADVAARFHRQLGDDVFFLTGTDEHGSKVEQAAAARGLSPKEHADQMVVKFKEVARKIEASNDFFIRTTDPQHEEFVQQFVQRIYDAGYVYKGAYSGLYCAACEAYYNEADLVDGLCPDHGVAPVYMEEDNYFFRLSAFQERLAEYYRSHPDFVRPRHRYNEALAFIEQGLADISISRATLKWGIKVPWDETQVIYVWVDALVNYLSALTYARSENLLPRFWPATYHVMAQDILKFHGVIWPALLMAAGYELPEHLFIHGYLKLGGEKMSKTRGNVMDPFPLIEQYGADSFRFYCLREVNFGQDGIVSEESFKARYNAELANELGNLFSRTAGMISKYRRGVVPNLPVGRPPESSPLAAEAKAVCEAVRDGLLEMDLSGALESAWTFVRRLNRYVEEAAPWRLAKQASAGDSEGEQANAALDAALWDLAEGLRLLSVLLYPFMPATALAMRAQLGLPCLSGQEWPSWQEAKWGLMPAGTALGESVVLFPRIEE
ncbi:MAG: methionine--tRNA ligase [Thermoleophilia bacterium]|nr:methionine--tRNA ligase [Thermoleophilia bacterium]